MNVGGVNHRSGGSASEMSIRETIDSDFPTARKIQKRVLAAVDACGYGGQSRFAIQLAVEEVLINAIKHGNQLDPAKKVHVNVTVAPNQTEIIVEDEGPGFERAKVPDPTKDENLEKIDGRGILLMESYMDLVEYSKGGRRIRMIRKNQERPPRPH
jgi:serine/threonine-protein kinase RsbW